MFETITPKVTSYRKKLKIIGTLVTNDCELHKILTVTFKICKERDL